MGPSEFERFVAELERSGYAFADHEGNPAQGRARVGWRHCGDIAVVIEMLGHAAVVRIPATETEARTAFCPACAATEDPE